MVKIQYCSDIHLEFLEQFSNSAANFEDILTPGISPYLVLAGDIGQPHLSLFRLFFEWCSQNWKEVYYVTGNHEYYSTGNPPESMDSIEDEIGRQLADLKNVHWLCLGCPGGSMSRDIEGTDVTLIGTTLWTNIDDDAENTARFAMMDYKLIGSPHPHPKKGVQLIQPYEVSILHMLQKQNLANEIRVVAARERKIVVVTHHLPSYKCIAPQFVGLDLNCCFASHSDDLIGMPGVVAWIYGHTHDLRRTWIGKCLCVVNAVGYPGENKLQSSGVAVIDLDEVAPEPETVPGTVPGTVPEPCTVFI
jgi:predicted phosphodiesterase